MCINIKINYHVKNLSSMSSNCLFHDIFELELEALKVDNKNKMIFISLIAKLTIF